jgi:hypothetical protein
MELPGFWFIGFLRGSARPGMSGCMVGPLAA